MGRAEVSYITGPKTTSSLKETDPTEVTGLKVPKTLAGRFKYYQSKWTRVISDKTTLSWLSEYKIPFHTKISQTVVPKEPDWSFQERRVILKQITQLKDKGVISRVEAHPKQFVSRIFLIKKHDGSHRLILTLKILNKSKKKLR